MSIALMIWFGSIIIMPGGIDMVFAIAKFRLRANPVKDIITPKILVSMPVPRNQKAALFFGLK